ncbi:hypothetical protein HK100_000523 [Physocladia obscura]|uniref:Homeobox domain-containing protein n=1 Tax=Physocladia obscura TaxID=109957 RepID=A0AAD5XCH2_9FUNG|nr:hypothetical protein HK100_000523 [Physocladia obscura]
MGKTICYVSFPSQLAKERIYRSKSVPTDTVLTKLPGLQVMQNIADSTVSVPNGVVSVYPSPRSSKFESSMDLVPARSFVGYLDGTSGIKQDNCAQFRGYKTFSSASLFQMSPAQLVVLERVFSMTQAPTSAQFQHLSDRLSIPRSAVMAWFQRKRSQLRKEKFIDLVSPAKSLPVINTKPTIYPDNSFTTSAQSISEAGLREVNGKGAMSIAFLLFICFSLAIIVVVEMKLPSINCIVEATEYSTTPSSNHLQNANRLLDSTVALAPIRSVDNNNTDMTTTKIELSDVVNKGRIGSLYHPPISPPPSALGLLALGAQVTATHSQSCNSNSLTYTHILDSTSVSSSIFTSAASGSSGARLVGGGVGGVDAVGGALGQVMSRDLPPYHTAYPRRHSPNILASDLSGLAASSSADNRPLVEQRFLAPPTSGTIRATKAQLKVLQKIFTENQMPSGAMHNAIAEKIGMSRNTVRNWFQNQRAKTRRLQLEATAAAVTTGRGVESYDSASDVGSNVGSNLGSLLGSNVGGSNVDSRYALSDVSSNVGSHISNLVYPVQRPPPPPQAYRTQQPHFQNSRIQPQLVDAQHQQQHNQYHGYHQQYAPPLPPSQIERSHNQDVQPFQQYPHQNMDLSAGIMDPKSVGNTNNIISTSSGTRSSVMRIDALI